MRIVPQKRQRGPKVSTPVTYTDDKGVIWASHSVYATPAELYKDPNLVKEQRWMHAGLLAAFDRVRHELGHELAIKSGKRTQKTQDELRERGYKAALVSPHVAGLAIDVVVPAYMRDVQLAAMFKEAVLDVCGTLPRMGYVQYRSAGSKSSLWLHVDVAPAVWHEGLPDAWRIEGLIW